MEIRPTETYNPNQPSPAFGLNRRTRTVFYPESYKKVVDTVELKNGKSVTFTKVHDQFGNLTEKLSYVRDEIGNWVKSKLQMYENGKITKVLRSRKTQ